MAPMNLPPGFRFHPTDEELVAYYLDRKINGRSIELEIIPEVDLYKCEPWDLPDKSFLPSKDLEWYFYSPRDKKYPNGSRTNRATKTGYWKATGKDRPVHSQRRSVGMKKTLVFYRGRAPHGVRTNWVMHEYRLLDSSLGTSSSSLKDSYALCRVFKKATEIPKTKEEKTEKVNSINNEDPCVSDEQLLAEDISGTGICKETENEDEDFNNDNYSKFPSDTSSSDVTQGTTIGTSQLPPFASDEANSSVNMYSCPVNFSTKLQDMQIPCYSSMHNQLPYPPLELEDFPMIDIAATKPKKSEITEEYLTYDKDKDCISGTLEEIFSFCSSQDNDITLSMHED